MKKLIIALSFAVLGATLVGVSAQAQGRGFVSAGAGRAGAGIERGRFARGGPRRQGHVRRFFAGSAYAPYFYSDAGYASDFGYNSAYEPNVEAPSPQIVFEESLPAAAPPSPPKPTEGLVLLEVQGDHWVRITHDGPPQIVRQSYKAEPEQATNLPAAAPSAVLVFRDGHKEEIGKYYIMGATIHITADYWSSGSWTRMVQISDLDVPATLKLNQERGTHFRLPSGPYEVMIGG